MVADFPATINFSCPFATTHFASLQRDLPSAFTMGPATNKCPLATSKCPLVTIKSFPYPSARRKMRRPPRKVSITS